MHPISENFTSDQASQIPGFVDEYNDVSTEWSEIRAVEMAGFDYVFAPMDVCNQINDFATLQEFLVNAQALLGSDPRRTILIGFERASHSNTLMLDRYDVEWAEDLIIDCRRTSINGSSQYDFIEMLFDHSDKLLDI
ncbi:hypothetical protein P886_3687 [Alteromonadaceae bacterium 2753L.S.0a.02]|nr:hypothetical protein P886_3687 [Alteromonadaceae bacterium 2753L.S.0a.02]